MSVSREEIEALVVRYEEAVSMFNLLSEQVAEDMRQQQKTLRRLDEQAKVTQDNIDLLNDIIKRLDEPQAEPVDDADWWKQ